MDYNYDAIRKTISRAKIEAGPPTLWRYWDLLPVETREPVPVDFAAEGGVDLLVAARALAGAAGVWYVAEEKGALRASVTRLLLHPEPLEKAAPGFRSDLEARAFALPGVSLGPPGMKVAAALGEVPGVLSVLPDLARERVTVVGRRGGAPASSILAALRGAGVEAREER